LNGKQESVRIRYPCKRPSISPCFSDLRKNDPHIGVLAGFLRSDGVNNVAKFTSI
jgi:hypothetical protein